MKELISVSIRSWHFMAINMLSTVFMSIANQQYEVGEWAVNKAQDESVNRLLKQLGMQTFIGGWVYPACLQNTPYTNYAFPSQGLYHNQPVPYLPTHGSAKVCRSVPPGVYPMDSPTAVVATAQQGPVTEGGEPAPR